MKLGVHVLLAAQCGLSEIDRDRDRALTFEAHYGGSPALDVYLRTLALERAQHVLMMDAVDELRRQDHPALRYDVRPTRMLKAALRAGVRRTGTVR